MADGKGLTSSGAGMKYVVALNSLQKKAQVPCLWVISQQRDSINVSSSFHMLNHHVSALKVIGTAGSLSYIVGLGKTRVVEIEH